MFYQTNVGGGEPEEPEGETSQEPTPAVTIPGGPCEKTITKIGSVQGTGTGTPLSGTVVTVKGIVTAVFPRLSG